MLESFTAETFAPHVGEIFRIDAGNAVLVDLRLSEVAVMDSRYHRGPRSTAPFSIVFHGPRETPLSQRTYPVEHDVVGSFALFLVPIEPDNGGPRYEAVFN